MPASDHRLIVIIASRYQKESKALLGSRALPEDGGRLRLPGRRPRAVDATDEQNTGYTASHISICDVVWQEQALADIAEFRSITKITAIITITRQLSAN